MSAVGGAGVLVASTNVASAAVVSRIDVRGNSRMDAQTVASYLTIKPGQQFNNQDIDDSIKALFGTGLFTDVSIYQSGNTLVVEVDESGIVNQVFFEGNKRLKDEALSSIVQTSSRSTYSEDKVASDVDRIMEAYSRVFGRKDATVSYEVVPLNNKRGQRDLLSMKATRPDPADFLVGNQAFGERRLRTAETKPSNWFSWLKNDDIYDADKLRTEERLRFYYNNGYADFQVLSSDVNFDRRSKPVHDHLQCRRGSVLQFRQCIHRQHDCRD
ncbi:MAG: POTRA domain-containing protein [Nitratireductor sp.]